MNDIQLKVLGRYKVSLVVKKKNKKKNYYKFDLLTKIIINIFFKEKTQGIVLAHARVAVRRRE